MRRGIRVVGVGLALFGALVLSEASPATGQGTPPVADATEVPLSVQARQREAEHPEIAERRAALAALTEASAGGIEAGPGAPSTTVTPDTGLVHDQEVLLEGEGWRPRERLIAVQCTPGALSTGWCEVLTDVDFPEFPRADTNGRFTIPEQVEVILDAPDGPIDCRLVTCQVGVGRLAAVGTAASTLGGGGAFVDVTFDPGGPDPARYTVAGTPDTGLVDGDIVSVTGSGFPLDFGDFGIAVVTPCRMPVVVHADCDDGQSELVEVLPNGDIDGRAWATAILSLASGPYDCRTGSCALAVRPDDFVTLDGRGELSEAGIIPLAFDPGGALRPPPTLTADPNTGLLDGDAVELTASGFDPNRGFTIQQCRAGATTLEDCRSDLGIFGGSSTSDFTFFMSLHARFRDGNGGLVDCRVTACSVVVAHGDLGRHGEALTEFDPEGSLLEPTLSVTPSTGLADGDELSVTGSGWPEAESIIVGQCPADAYDLFECDFENSVFVDTPPSNFEAVPVAHTRAEAIESAGFSVTIPVHTIVRTDYSRVDCRLEPCTIAAQSFGDDRVVRVPISFGGAQGPIPATPPFTG